VILPHAEKSVATSATTDAETTAETIVDGRKTNDGEIPLKIQEEHPMAETDRGSDDDESIFDRARRLDPALLRERNRVHRAKRMLNQALRDLREELMCPNNSAGVKAGLSRVKECKQRFFDAANDSLRVVEDPYADETGPEKDTLVKWIESKMERYQRSCSRGEAAALQYQERLEAAKDAERQEAKRAAKLPELKLKEFHGQPAEYPAWRDHFRSNVEDRPNLSNVDKMQYLQAACKGTAARMLQRYRATNANFDVVMRALEDRFGKKGEVLEQTFRAIEGLRSATQSPQASIGLVDDLVAHLSTLTEMGIDVNEPNQTANILTNFKPKIFPEAIGNWKRYCKTRGWEAGNQLPTMADFLDFILDELDTLTHEHGRGDRRQQQQQGGQRDRRRDGGNGGTALTQSGAQGGTARAEGRDTEQSHPWSDRKKKKPKNKSSGGAGGATGSESRGKTGGWREANANKCAFCDQQPASHSPAACPKGKNMSTKDKKSRLRTFCWRCLSSGHTKTSCPQPKAVCGVDGCGCDHHKLIHDCFPPPK
jgi:hypothetical protein